jgi:DNA-directed RNA polymerase, mitochondrial
MDLQKLEADATELRNRNKRDRTIKMLGWGATDEGLALADKVMATVAAEVPAALERLMRANSEVRCFAPLADALSPQVIAGASLQSCLSSIARNDKMVTTLEYMGQSLEDEAFGAGLTKHSKKLADMVGEKAKRHGGTLAEQRAYGVKQAAKGSKATRYQKAIAAFQQDDWGNELRVHVGKWMLELLLNAAPDVFAVEGLGHYQRVALTEDAQETAEAVLARTLGRFQVWLPMLEPPRPWTTMDGGGPIDGRIHRTHVLRLKNNHVETQQMAEAACLDGTMKPALDGVNALQAVPWRINKRVLGVLRECIARDIKVEGLPKDKVSKPKLADIFPGCDDFNALSEAEKAEFLAEKAKATKHNQAVMGDRLDLQTVLSTAEMFEDAPRFFTPMNMDFRGRVYAMTAFNFQREDRVRSLFLFSDGEPLGDDGLYWLKVHAANCWAGDDGTGRKVKTDKIPLKERAAWIDANLERIEALTDTWKHDTWWTEADSPFLFLAVCFEIATALRTGTPSSYVCSLPVSFDGSCSGLQHYCAMTRAPEGSLVNLTPQTLPADVYASVAAIVLPKVENASGRTAWPEGEEWRGECAKLWLAYGVTRKEVKRNVMTWPYSSKARGMAGQIQVDIMDKLADAVTEKKLPVHPFAPYERGTQDMPGKAARFLADIVYESIGELIYLPQTAMNFLQGIAKVLAKNGLPAKWYTPVGIPWVNRYCEIETTRLAMWLNVRGVKFETKHEVATGEDETAIRESKSVNAVAPNFVHANDASHLLLVAAAARREGIVGLATVHDSFGCLPSRARRFNALIREQFVEMYERHDVLAEVLAQAKRDLNVTHQHLLPDLFQYGDLDLNSIKDSDYAFA